MRSDNSDRLIGIRRTTRNRHVLGISQRRVEGKHRTVRPLDQPRPHFSHEDQRRIFKMPHLEQLPNHHRFQDRSDSPWRNDVGVGGEHELVEARKERPVLERLGNESVDFLFKGKSRASMASLIAALPQA